MVAGGSDNLPLPERGRMASAASRVGVRAPGQYNRTTAKTARAGTLRRNSTAVERRLWSWLRDGRLDGLSFQRQHPAGRYILNFYCPQLGLAVELDGGHHTLSRQEVHDQKRTAWLRGRGVTELRFWNNDVTKSLYGVLEKSKKPQIN
jgi:very-short-patch-repair endonuclease